MKATDRKPANAFVTARKGFYYLTIKLFGRHREMMRVRGYRIDPDKKGRDGEPVFGIYESGTRTVYSCGMSSTAAGVGRLLDAILQLNRERPAMSCPQDVARDPVKLHREPIRWRH